MASNRRGNCYAASEALRHILGPGWHVYRMRTATDTHWFLKHGKTGVILDPSRRQFRRLPDYTQAVRTGFLTKRPSKKARALMQCLTWQPA